MSIMSGIKNHWGFHSLQLQGDVVHTLSVNTGNGNLVCSATDFTIPLRVPLVFMRTYNSTNTSETGLLGKGWQFGFEERLIRIDSNFIKYVDTTGAEWLFELVGSVYTAPPGIFCSLEEESPNIFVMTMLNGFTRRFEFPSVNDTVAKLIEYRDTNNISLFFGWDGDELTGISQGLSAIKECVIINNITYSNNTIETITYGSNPLNLYTINYTYDGECLQTATNPNGDAWTYGYDVSDRLSSLMDPEGAAATPQYSTAIAYNGSNQASALTDADGQSIGFNYDASIPEFISTTITDRRLNTTVNKHSIECDYALTEVIVDIDTISYTSQYIWDEDTLRLTEYIDNNSNSITYSYYQWDRRETDLIETITNALLKITVFTYDDANCNLLSVRTPMGNTTKYEYDANRNLTGINRPMDPVDIYTTTFTYTQLGDLKSSTDPCGQKTCYEYTSDQGCLLKSARE